MRIRTSACGALLFAALVLLYLGTMSRRLGWDGIAFLQRSMDLRHPDLAHLAYSPALAGVRSLLAPLGIEAETAARLFSTAASAGSATILFALLVACGTRRRTAVISALLLATSPTIWSHATDIEVYAPCLFFILSAAACALWVRSHPGLISVTVLGLAWAAAVSFHVAATISAIGIFTILRHDSARLPLGVKLLPIVLTLLAAGLWLVSGWPASLLGNFAHYVGAFLPRPAGAGETASLIGEHLDRLWLFASENEPVLVAAAVLGLLAMLLLDRTRLLPVLAFALPGVIVFALLGVPLLGLLVPVLAPLAFAAGRGAGAGDRYARGGATLLLAAACVLQVIIAAPDRWRDAREPDPQAVAARVIADTVPERAVVVSGMLTMHLRWYTGLKVLSIGIEARQRLANTGPPLDGPRMLREMIASDLAAKHPVFITRDGAIRLFNFSRPAFESDAATYQALAPSFTDLDHPIVIPSDPPLLLYSLRPPPE